MKLAELEFIRFYIDSTEKFFGFHSAAFGFHSTAFVLNLLNIKLETFLMNEFFKLDLIK